MENRKIKIEKIYKKRALRLFFAVLGRLELKSVK